MEQSARKFQRSFLTLSEALSYLAFGVELDGRACLERILYSGLPGGREEAAALMNDSILALIQAAISGKLVFIGRFRNDTSKETLSLTQTIDPLAFHDFSAVDLVGNCLGPGNTLEFDEHYEFDACIVWQNHQQHYADVQVDAKSLRSLGNSLKLQEPKKTRLPDPQLNRWWARVAAQAATMTGAELLKAVRLQYPNNSISRNRVRVLMGPRKRGKKPFGGKIPAK